MGKKITLRTMARSNTKKTTPCNSYFCLLYLVISILLLLINLKTIPYTEEEDSTSSREFWLFVGALVLFISAFQISFSTSIPVINKIFGSELAPPEDVISHYHSWQIPFAAIVALLISVGQFFKYKYT